MQDKKPVEELDDSFDTSNPTQTESKEPETSTPDQTDDFSDNTSRLESELLSQKDKYLRLFAEFDNYKRRNAREMMELRQTAGKEIIISLLEVMDDFDRAEKQLQTSDDIEQIKEGVSLVFNKLKTTLQSKGLKAMESINTVFDIEKHEAVAEIPVEKNLKGKVVDEIVKGYYLNDKLIRFAKVVVGK